ncbi:MAG: hypothetical protein JSV47_12720 [Deltaproteobacteria bacterium]|nr:MAG: hypothetical protein JSV47_12720 [Deltaproteobacteria bacterium]
MIIVIMILGIMGVLLTPHLHSMITQAKLNDATAELVAGIQYARDLSVTHQRVFGLTADVGENWFKVIDHQYKDDANPHHDSVPPVDTYGLLLHPVDKTWYSRDFDTSANHEGVSINAVPASGAIFFYPDGHSSELNSVFVLALKGDQKTITVDGITGRISVQ